MAAKTECLAGRLQDFCWFWWFSGAWLSGRASKASCSRICSQMIDDLQWERWLNLRRLVTICFTSTQRLSTSRKTWRGSKFSINFIASFFILSLLADSSFWDATISKKSVWKSSQSRQTKPFTLQTQQMHLFIKTTCHMESLLLRFWGRTSECWTWVCCSGSSVPSSRCSMTKFCTFGKEGSSRDGGTIQRSRSWNSKNSSPSVRKS